uniref:S9 family peptidase n=1 Tax=Schistosoma curassoni TaxID=6186 RepID=A0A183L4C4_9TREM
MYITFLPSGRVTRLLLVTTANGRPRAWRISLAEYDSSAPPNLATDSGKSYNLIL